MAAIWVEGGIRSTRKTDTNPDANTRFSIRCCKSLQNHVNKLTTQYRLAKALLAFYERLISTISTFLFGKHSTNFRLSAHGFHSRARKGYTTIIYLLASYVSQKARLGYWDRNEFRKSKTVRSNDFTNVLMYERVM